MASMASARGTAFTENSALCVLMRSQLVESTSMHLQDAWVVNADSFRRTIRLGFALSLAPRLCHMTASFLAQTVQKEWTDIVLILGCVATGLLDAAVFNVWSCFVSMQTGNTVYVGLGVTGQPLSQPHRWAKSGTAILGFTIGSFAFARLMRWLTPLKRSTLLISSTLQLLLTVVPAVMSSTPLIPEDAGDLIQEGNYIVLLPLALLAFQAGGQCVLSRFLGYGEVPTVVLTSAYCDLAMDSDVFKGLSENSKRNRRLLSVAMVIAGAAVGGAMTHHRASIASALWVVASLKALMTVAWAFWPSERHIALE